jgi:mRNA-degrading endonuclease YafQ of YafQ-DinJ toxin-antitoxin module
MFGTTRGTKKKHPEEDAFLVYKLQDCGFSRTFGTTRGTKKKHPEVDAFLVYKLQDCGFLS